MNKQTATVSIKSWCDDCTVLNRRTGRGCDGHFMCSRPVLPEGYYLTGIKELTPTGWREDAEPIVDYIHAPGCTCFSDPEARAKVIDQRAPYGSRSGAATALPPGACPGWFASGSWPCDHIDHHLLARHAAAVAAKEAVASFVFNRSLDGDALLAERAAWDAAIVRQRETREVLAAALHAAQWGAQPDGSFVTRASLTCGGMAARSTLHAPAKQGPLAEVEDHERGNDYTLTALRTREKARTIRDVERCENRDAERMYAALRRRAGAVLRDGGELRYSPGQEYGTVEIHDRWVSARGALVAAGMTKQEATALLENVMAGGMLSLRGVTADMSEGG
jgi:hypothetical protein